MSSSDDPGRDLPAALRPMCVRWPSSDSPASCNGMSRRSPFRTHLIAGDAELRRLNLKFRAKDQATDVLSFPGETFSSLAIFPCKRARAQARAFRHSAEEEIRILICFATSHSP